MNLIIGTRKSNLAIAQVKEIVLLLKKKKLHFNYSIKTFLTPGDRDKKTSIENLEGTDFFTRDLHNALIKKEIDIAVHSAKDLPDELNDKLEIAAITKGVDNRDVIVVNSKFRNIINKKNPLLFLPKGFRIGTCSKRRKEQIRNLRKDLNIIDIRGTIEERLQLIEKRKVDGIIIASAGLIRLGLINKINAYFLNFNTSPLQGRLAVEIRKDNKELKEIFSIIDDRINWGTVYIVGAGPGNPDLLTQKALRILKNIDVVLYDSLVDNSILQNINSKKIDVGKRKDEKNFEQEEINIKMVKFAHNGLKVCRLKGGDPSVFAHIAEELRYLRKNFVKYEIIPGVSSFLASAVYSEVAITERNHHSYFLVSTGYPLKRAYIPDKNYKGTIIYMMCGDTIKIIAKKLRQKGWSNNTDVVLVSNATLYNQQIIKTNLVNIQNIKESIEKPVIAFIGESILINKKSWYEDKIKVLFTGTNYEKYSHLGEVFQQPLLNLKPIKFKISKNKIKSYDLFLFTSKHSVKYFFKELFNSKLDARIMKDKIICSIGKITTEELKKYGIIPDIESYNPTKEEFFKTLKNKGIKNKKIYYPCSNLTNDYLYQELIKLNNQIKKEVIYKNLFPKNLKKLELKYFDKIFFTSPSTVKNFKKLYTLLPDKEKTITIGPITQEALIYEKFEKNQNK